HINRGTASYNILSVKSRIRLSRCNVAQAQYKVLSPREEYITWFLHDSYYYWSLPECCRPAVEVTPPAAPRPVHHLPHRHRRAPHQAAPVHLPAVVIQLMGRC